MLPVKADIREAIGKDVGDVVTVILEERIESAKSRPKRSGSP
jgi:flagellar basal body L-ring protein FlgH